MTKLRYLWSAPRLSEPARQAHCRVSEEAAVLHDDPEASIDARHDPNSANRRADPPANLKHAGGEHLLGCANMGNKEDDHGGDAGQSPRARNVPQPARKD